MIELRGVSKSYPGHLALDNFDLTVNAGERVILFGPSGCGKTTVLQMIAGLTAPDGGSILINGEVASKANEVVVAPERRGLGYVFQDLALWPHMTVFENVEFGLKARGVVPAQRLEQVCRLLDMVKLSVHRESMPARLSGGEQQRVAIARALAGNPVSIMMDEPMANLDDDLRGTLCHEILDLQALLGFSLIGVTHRRDEIQMLQARPVLMFSTD